jgi:predicted nicotinamide N-methyase
MPSTKKLNAHSNSVNRSVRVLLLGAKAGLLAVAAVRAGAVHVTCVEQ